MSQNKLTPQEREALNTDFSRAESTREELDLFDPYRCYRTEREQRNYIDSGLRLKLTRQRDD